MSLKSHTTGVKLTFLSIGSFVSRILRCKNRTYVFLAGCRKCNLEKKFQS